MQFAVANVQILAGIVALPDNSGVVGFFGQVAVDAIDAGVELAVGEPFDGDVIGLPGNVADLRKLALPKQLARLGRPKGVSILQRLAALLLFAASIGG